ncbi:MAG TPA: SufD family Fe-S cluster assembly protein [Candidatus Thermoplasmatota archaeon]|nr:SufD family Fe-S cluster assembly protein [Candidatus Thermoplasmatota archaeon]
MNALLSSQSIRERSKARGEPDWLVDLRAEALARYQALEAPQWRRTEIADLDIEALAWRAFGRGSPLAKRSLAKAPGVVHIPLAEAAREHPDLVQPLVRLSPRADKWEALDAALWSDGSLLYVEKGTEVAGALESPARFAPEAGVVRDLVVVDRQAKLQALARAQGASKGALALHGIETSLRDGARLALSTIQDIDHGATLLAWRRTHLARDSELSWVDGQFGAATSVSVNENLLDGPGASLKFVGAFFGSAGQHMDITTAALHGAPHTSSQLDMKGALNDDGYSANYSIVFIGTDAKNASGHQHQETMVLSEGARADAIPKLDVENNDVSASHGATVGQVDPEQLFYLQSRGLHALAAKRVIVEGFFEPLLSKIQLEDVREEVRSAIVSRLKK